MAMGDEEVTGDLGISRRRLVELDAFKPPEHGRQRQVDLGRRRVDPQALARPSAEGDEVFLVGGGGLFRASSSRCCCRCCRCRRCFGCQQPAVQVEGLWVREFHRVLVLQ